MFCLRRFPAQALAAVLTLTCACLCLRAQWPQNIRATPEAPVTVTLSDSAMPLTGPWRFQPGDAPVIGGLPLWAEPGFDDSRWKTLELPSSTAFRESMPGWMGQGFPQVTQGYAWYRLTLQVRDANRPLWLKMPNSFDDAFQLYANGKLVGSAGFQTGKPVAYYSLPYSFALPPPDAHGLITLALRFWLDPGTRFDEPRGGGLHRAPILGLASTIRTMQAHDITALILFNVITEGVLPLFFLFAAFVSFWAWFRVRQESAYLWLALRLLLNTAGALVYDLALAGKLPQAAAAILLGILLRALLTPGWIVFWWHWFQLRRERWILWATLVLTVLDLLSASWARATSHGILPSQWATWLPATNTLIKFSELALLGVTFWRGFRRDRTEALLALLPLAINEIDVFNGFSVEALLGFDVPVLGMHLPPSAIASFLLVLTIGALAVRRFLAIHARRVLHQQVLEADLVQASELQQRVLLPETGQSRAVQVSTAYLPAQTMGGDFFQVLCDAEGATLVVLGDVSGKGVAAAFLVAVLVGAMRTRADQSLDPAGMLQMLNGRLLGRSQGHFATCLAILIERSGRCTAVNAGHLAPYLNGEEVSFAGSLPLGMVANTELDVLYLSLTPRDRLTLLSDGVVEAMTPGGELFGFEQAKRLSLSDAEEIALRAQRYGQQDDITVLTIDFLGAPGPHFA